MISDSYPVNIFQYISLHDKELELSAITACYACRKEESHKSCDGCFSTLINSIIDNGRPDFEVLRSKKLIKKNGKYYNENGREVIDKTFISCADVFGNVQELA